jgi:hypothetical protein
VTPDNPNLPIQSDIDKLKQEYMETIHGLAQKAAQFNRREFRIFKNTVEEFCQIRIKLSEVAPQVKINSIDFGKKTALDSMIWSMVVNEAQGIREGKKKHA